MNWEHLFSQASTLALLAWLLLAFGPRRYPVVPVIRLGVIGLLCVAYVPLVLVYFFRVEGGGFGTLQEVRTLFASEPVVLAGWIHYLAFDLFVGLWIAEMADQRDWSRIIQVPVLLATFMFGPLGLLLASAATLVSSTQKSPLATGGSNARDIS